jgi:hypothetical protein
MENEDLIIFEYHRPSKDELIEDAYKEWLDIIIGGGSEIISTEKNQGEDFVIYITKHQNKKFRGETILMERFREFIGIIFIAPRNDFKRFKTDFDALMDNIEWRGSNLGKMLRENKGHAKFPLSRKK